MQEDKIIKISEEQAEEMLNSIVKISSLGDLDSLMKVGIAKDSTLKNWKEKGFIEESNLDKARETYEKIKKVYNSFDDVWFWLYLRELKDHYEEEIKELQNKLSKKE